MPLIPAPHRTPIMSYKYSISTIISGLCTESQTHSPAKLWG